MTMLVHLIDERDSRSVARVGLRGALSSVRGVDAHHELDRAVYAMPVLPNYFVSHQWLRELKRRGMRTLAAVHFRMRADALVWVGRYNGEHRQVPLGHAAGLIMHEPDQRGWEIIIPHDIPSKSIHAIREVPQVVGWRYFPDSHAKGPWKCLCDFCLQGVKGEIKSKSFVRRLIDKHGAEATNYEGDVAKLAKKRRRR